MVCGDSCADGELDDLLHQLPEPKQADYGLCPHCDSTKGRWWGFSVRKDGTFIRRRMCRWCKRTYTGAWYRNVHRSVNLNEAKRIMRSKKDFTAFEDDLVFQ